MTEGNYKQRPPDTMTIAQRVINIIIDKSGIRPDMVKPDSELIEDLGFDSLDTVELIMDFEKEFGISIADREAEGAVTVRDAIKMIESKISE